MDIEKTIVVDEMLLTKDCPTTAGSKMLEGYQSLLEAEILTRLNAAGFCIGEKAKVGEFSIDLTGETAFDGAIVENGKLMNHAAKLLKEKKGIAAVGMDVNGSICRGAAQNELISLKPTYGTVSRFGTIPVVCSGETVSVTAEQVEIIREILDVISGHDDKDGTSLSEEQCACLKKDFEGKTVARVALPKSMKQGIDNEVSEKLGSFSTFLSEKGIEVCEIEDEVICLSRIAWNILMCAELCNNVSRYDGVKYGYRSQNFTNIDELYTNSRTEAFGDVLKTAILFGSETLSTDNYMKVYDKALRTRRVISEAFEVLFKEYDAVLMPACSKMEYTAEQVKENKYLAFEENFYTAPASITGLPTVTVGGVQLVGAAFSEASLLKLAQLFEKEGK